MADPVLVIDPEKCDAVIFDMDGVLTDTAQVHARAWKQMFDEYLTSRSETRSDSFEEFDIDQDYKRYIDGKPRYEGVQSFLASRGIELDRGETGDPPDARTICGLGNRKNQLFLERLREEGAVRFDEAVKFVRQLQNAGIRVAVISASRNAREVLEEAGIAGLFEVRVDGIVAARQGLEGKPAPDVFVEAARRLEVEPGRCVIVEDALAGVEAGKRGDFAQVIGVSRENGVDALREAGADVVVRDLTEITVAGE